MESYGVERTFVAVGLQDGRLDKAVQRKIKHIVKHPDYEKNDPLMDYGLIEITEPIELGKKSNIYPACLLVREIDDFDYGLLLVTGRGRSQRLYMPNSVEGREMTRDGRQFARVKRKISLHCDSSFLLCFTSNSTEICAGDSGKAVLG